MLFVGPAREALGPAECGQQTLVRPARRTGGVGPRAEILPGPAHMGHCMQTARSSDHASAGPVMRTAGSSRLGRGAVGPIVVAPGERRPLLRDRDVRIARRAAGLNDADPNIPGFGSRRALPGGRSRRSRLPRSVHRRPCLLPSLQFHRSSRTPEPHNRRLLNQSFELEPLSWLSRAMHSAIIEPLGELGSQEYVGSGKRPTELYAL